MTLSIDPSKCSPVPKAETMSMPDKYVVIGGGDGYHAVIVEGLEAARQAYIGMFFDPVPEPPTEEVEILLERFDDPEEWKSNYALGPVRLRVSLEDGYVEVIRVPDGKPGETEAVKPPERKFPCPTCCCVPCACSSERNSDG